MLKHSRKFQPGFIYATKFHVHVNGLNCISAHVVNPPEDGILRLGIYSDENGNPKELLFESCQIPMASRSKSDESIKKCQIDDQFLKQGDTVWVCFVGVTNKDFFELKGELKRFFAGFEELLESETEPLKGLFIKTKKEFSRLPYLIHEESFHDWNLSQVGGFIFLSNEQFIEVSDA